jgi:hypothetical protein
MPSTKDVRTVQFVCQHGASRSRIAAAWFTLAAPPGWRAASAGLDPAETLNPNAARPLDGTAAEGLLDRNPPMPIAAVPESALVVAIDCDVAGAARWDLAVDEPCGAMRCELAVRATALAWALAPALAEDAR